MKKIWIALMLMLTLPGYGKQPEALPSHLVVGITVTRDGISRHYARQDCMARLLGYLRRLDPYGKATEDPNTLPGEDFRIRLEYSDGGEKNYRQKNREYLQVENRPWQQIDPGDARELSLLFEVLPET